MSKIMIALTLAFLTGCALVAGPVATAGQDPAPPQASPPEQPQEPAQPPLPGKPPETVPPVQGQPQEPVPPAQGQPQEPVQPTKPVPPPVPGPLSVNVIRGNGNGIGNSVVISNQGSSGGVTYVSNNRLGVGNRLVIINRDGQQVYVGKDLRYPKDKKFWTATRMSKELGYTLYWCPQTQLWFRYLAADECFRPAWDALFPMPDLDALMAPMRMPNFPFGE
jgi:hypothetical protein